MEAVAGADVGYPRERMSRLERNQESGKALLRRREVPIPEKLKFVTRKSNLWKPI
jgi:hypothetical protein